jgi:hypothetical protein
MTALHRRNSWAPGDFGNAMASWVQAHAREPRQTPDGITSEAWYRGGDNPSSLRVWATKGTWSDARAGIGGGAKSFAATVAGMPLRSLMSWATGAQDASYGPRLPCPMPGPPPVSLAPQGDAEDAWRLVMDAADADATAAYLLGRGIDAALVETGAALVASPRGMPPGLQRFASDGPAVFAPLRSARTNRIMAIQGRAVTGAARVMSGKAADDDGVPRAYGWPGAASRARVVVLVEGMVDTMAAAAALRDDADVVTVGAYNDRALGRSIPSYWAAVGLSASVVIVPDLDPVDGEGLTALGNGQRFAREARRTLAGAGISARIFAWGAFLGSLLDHIHDPERVKDLADVASFTGWASFSSAFRRLVVAS